MLDATKRLQALIAAPGIIVAPNICDPISAMVAEREGFEVVAVSGAGAEAAILGKPDLGYVTLKEMVDHAGNIAAAVSTPVICDCDTGYGGVLNVRRTVEELERRGVAGIIIEDSDPNKRNAVVGWAELAPLPDAVNRYKAALDARRDDDFLVIARTDALPAGRHTDSAYEEAIARANTYLEAGAGMVFFAATQLRHHEESLPRMVNGHVLGGLHRARPGEPLITVQDQETFGYKMTLAGDSVASALPVYLRCYSRVLQTLKQHGSTELVADLIATPKEFDDFTHLSETIAKYLNPELVPHRMP